MTGLFEDGKHHSLLFFSFALLSVSLSNRPPALHPFPLFVLCLPRFNHARHPLCFHRCASRGTEKAREVVQKQTEKREKKSPMLQSSSNAHHLDLFFLFFTTYKKKKKKKTRQLVTDAPKPVPKPNEVLVRVVAASLNPIDFKLKRGDLGKLFTKTPMVPGADVAGVVVEASSSGKFAAGAKVYGIKSATDPNGTLAEFVAVPESQLAPIPGSLTFEQAASLPLAGLTALQALRAASAKSSDRVLVTAAAGGVGSLAVQLARGEFGCESVVGTCGPKNLGFVTEQLGASEAFDYTVAGKTLENTFASSAPFDVVVDMMGGATESDALAATKTKKLGGGRFASVLNSGTSVKSVASGYLNALWGKGPAYSVTVLSVKNAGEKLEKVFNKLVEEGKLKPVVAAVRPLEEAAAAFAELEAGHSRGKQVIKVGEEE